MSEQCDFLIIGAGIVGLSTAYQLQKKTKAKIIVIDKESKVAQHQSSHNSGVVHAGVYYAPGSLKASFCKAGVSRITKFCETHNIPLKNTGKLIVATDDKEYQAMLKLYERAQDNDIGISKLDESEVNKLEPNINSVGGLLSPSTSIVDYGKVSEKLAELFVNDGGLVYLDEPLMSVDEQASHINISTKNKSIQAEKVVCCAGLHSDRVARMFGAKVDYKVVPFRGEFFQIHNQPSNLVNHLIYPVPDPERPFLGVHITKKISGIFTVGPNAVLAGSREGYKLSDINIKDLAESLSYLGFWRMLMQNFSPAMSELSSSLFKKTYLKRVQKYCPQIQLDDLKHYPAGVRAQAVSLDGRIIDDFKFVETARSLHVCNAPSPAATASLPIGDYLVDKILN